MIYFLFTLFHFLFTMIYFLFTLLRFLFTTIYFLFTLFRFLFTTIYFLFTLFYFLFAIKNSIFPLFQVELKITLADIKVTVADSKNTDQKLNPENFSLKKTKKPSPLLLCRKSYNCNAIIKKPSACAEHHPEHCNFSFSCFIKSCCNITKKN